MTEEYLKSKIRQSVGFFRPVRLQEAVVGAGKVLSNVFIWSDAKQFEQWSLIRSRVKSFLMIYVRQFFWGANSIGETDLKFGIQIHKMNTLQILKFFSSKIVYNAHCLLLVRRKISLRQTSPKMM